MNTLNQQLANLSPEQRALFEKRLKQRQVNRSATPKPVKRTSSEPSPLSFAQQRLWFIQQLEPTNCSYNMFSALRFRGSLDRTVLHQALNELLRRHETLRTAFITNHEKQPLQVVLPAASITLPIVDLSHLPDAESEIQRLAIAQAQSPFDLTQVPLRLILLQQNPTEHVLLITAHHIIADRWSVGVFLQELTTLYNAFLAGQASPLADLPIQYADWALWQRQWLQGELLQAQIHYWQQQLQDLPVVELPTDHLRPAIPTYSGSHYRMALSKSLTDALKTLSAQSGVTLFTLLLAAFNVLLYRYTHQDDIVVGTDVANRDRTETAGLIGLLVNTLVLRTDLSGNPGFRELLSRVREVVLGALAHQDLPFEKLVEVLNPDRDLSQMSPLFQVKFDLQLAPVKPLTLTGLTVERLFLAPDTVKYELRLNLQDTEQGLSGQVEYSTDLFDAATIARLVDHFQTLLAGIIANPDCTIAQLPLLTLSEQQQLLEWNSIRQDYPTHLGIHQLFEAQVERTPDAIAIIHNSDYLAYAELNARANQIAHYLRSQNVIAETTVGIQLDRSIEMVIAILGILKAGAAYVPLDPAYPEERLTFMREDANVRIVISDETNWQAIAQERTTNPNLPVAPSQLAYVIYTSGSTGTPKGVAIEHRSVNTFIHWAKDTFTPEQLAGVLASTSICFDLSVFELFVPLSSGGTIILAENALQLPSLPAAPHVTLINTVPSAATELLRLNAIPPGVHTVNLAGEPLPAALVHQLYQQPTLQQVYNLYGPSEDTTYSIAAPLPAAPPHHLTPPIGRPLPNTQVYLLDRHLQPVPIGIPGELYLAGDGLARGYLHRPDLTAERFIPNPFSPSPSTHPPIHSSTLYKTGDLARYRPDGNLEYLGRTDHQVKIRGYRIEMGEIEAALHQHPAIHQAVVQPWQDERDHPRLVAHIVPVQTTQEPEATHPASPTHSPTLPLPHSPTLLRQFLEQKLPSYMVPSVFIPLTTLPRLPNGKIDRRVLPTPDLARPTLESTYVAPQTELEKTIATLWQQELKLEQIGIHDNFFELGGHSLLAIRLVAQISDVLQVDLPLRRLFQTPTIAGLAAYLTENITEQQLHSQLPILIPNPVERDRPFPLTDIQQAYWIGRSGAFELGNVATHGYREIETIGLTVERVERTIQSLIDRHDMLRVVVQPDGQQRILPQVPPYVIRTIDLRGQSSEKIDAQLLEIRDRLSHQVLSTDQYPLFDIQAAILDDQRIRFHISFDVLIGDAWSFQLLGQELAHQLQYPDRPLPPLDLSFRDYVLAERRFRDTELYRRAEVYWQSRLSTLPPPPGLPLVKSPQSIEQPRFVRRSGRLDPEVWQRLKQRAAQMKVSPSGIVLAAFAEVLAYWSKQPEFTLNLTLFNRLLLHPEVNQLVGDFTSSILLAVHARGRSFVERAQQLQAQLWEDLDHRYVSGVQVLRELARSQQRSGSALMPVVFTSILTQDINPVPTSSSWQSQVVYSLSQTSQVYLDHQVSEVNGVLVFNWDAIDELFPPGLLDDMFTAHSNLLTRLANDSLLWQSNTCDLLPVEQAKRLALINATDAILTPANPAPLLHTLFFDRASQQPDRPAIITAQRTFTYQELSDRACDLAQQLQQAGVQPNQRVAVVMEKGWEQVVAVLGILTTGAAYVPIDPDLPTERRFHLLKQTQAAIVLTQPRLNTSLDWLPHFTRLCIDLSLPSPRSTPPLLHSSTHSTLAYIIYTSGSTGTPKGVMIAHQGAVNTILDINQRFQVTADDRILALSSLSFDLSVYDIFGTLAAGGAIVIPDANATRDPRHWLDLIHQHHVTLWNSVPTLMQMLMESVQPESTRHKAQGSTLSHPPTHPFPHSLRLILLSGDWIPLHLPAQIREHLRAAQIISLGGATEASIWSILYPIDTINPTWKSIPYGRPMANQRFYVLNSALEPCPVWVTGQLYIGGIGLAKGYWQDDAKTQASFIIHPHTQERLYKTGDLGRYLPDGTIEFLGREDAQVKINGYRIELGEIEAALQQHPAIEKAVVTTGGEAQQRQLIAYVVPANISTHGSVVKTQSPDRIEFKLQQRGLRQRSTEFSIDLPRLSPDESNEELKGLYLRRQSHRQFLDTPIALEIFSQFIRCLSQIQLDRIPLPKYRYASAGSLYPVQTYVYIKPDRIQGVKAGVYYYHPADHCLVLLNEQAITSAIYGKNQAIFERSAFALFLVGQLDAIAPLYGEKARDFCLLEAGYMSQLLMETASDCDLGLCPIGALDFDAIEDLFHLESSHVLLHSLVGGAIDPLWLQQWTPESNQPSVSLSEQVREFLRQKLPDYMIPSQYVVLDSLPLTVNGKVNRRALPEPERLNVPSNLTSIAPRTELEQAIATIWQQILKIEAIGIHDNFFEIGGNSLSATQTLTQMRQRLQTELSMRQFFTAATIAEQARMIQQQMEQKAELQSEPQQNELTNLENTIQKLDRDIQLTPDQLDRLSEQELDTLLTQMLGEESDV